MNTANAQELVLVAPDAPTMELVYYSLDAFPDNEEILGAEPDARFVETLRHGLEYPISVAVDEFGTIVAIRDGRRRIKGLRKLKTPGDTQILCNAWRADEGSHALATLKLNHARKDNPVTDYLAIQDLIGRFGYTPKAVAQAAGMTTPEVERLMRISALHPRLLQGFIDGFVKPGIAHDITRRTQDQQTTLATILEENGKLTGDDVEWVRKQGVADASERISLQDTLIEEEIQVWHTWAQDGRVRVTLPGRPQVVVDEQAFMAFLEQYSAPTQPE